MLDWLRFIEASMNEGEPYVITDKGKVWLQEFLGSGIWALVIGLVGMALGWGYSMYEYLNP